IPQCVQGDATRLHGWEFRSSLRPACRDCRLRGRFGAEKPMQQQMTPPIPGNRIADYRNSKPRFVRLYGLGDRGASLARAIAREAGPNVAIKSGSQPVGWHEIAGDMPDPKTNMVVI